MEFRLVFFLLSAIFIFSALSIRGRIFSGKKSKIIGFNFSNWSFNVNMDFIDGFRDGNFFVNIGENEGGELVVSVPAGADFEKVNVVADCGKVVIALYGVFVIIKGGKNSLEVAA